MNAGELCAYRPSTRGSDGRQDGQQAAAFAELAVTSIAVAAERAAAKVESAEEAAQARRRRWRRRSLRHPRIVMATGP